MSEHPIEGMMDTTLEKTVERCVDANTVIGEPVVSPDGSVVIPVSRISYGFASGGSDFPSKKAVDKSFLEVARGWCYDQSRGFYCDPRWKHPVAAD